MMLGFDYAGSKIEFDVVFTRRRTMKIALEPPNTIVVTAPKGISETVIVDAVKSKAPWISKKLFMFSQMDVKPPHKFKNGEVFLYLGKEVYLSVVINKSIKKAKVDIYQKNLVVVTPKAEADIIKHALELWYREKTKEKLIERINYFKTYFSKEPGAIRVKEQKRRWASCTYKDDILFNWRCVMAAEEAFDYIVVHELCHMEYKNHSKDFWKRVESILPDYKVQKNWLKENGIRMEL